MNRQHRKKRFIVGMSLIAVLLIGCMYAYFQGTEAMENEFQVAQAKIYLNEKFNPKDEWLPGEEKQKEVRFGNDGAMEAVLRVKFTATMESPGNTLLIEPTDKVKLNFADTFENEWEKHGDWYYYKKVLEKSELTGITLKSVTISDEIGNDEHGIQKDYSKVIFDVQIESELLQASLAEESAKQQKWDLIPTVTGNQVQWKSN